MAAPIASGDSNATAMFALTSLEEQFIYLAQQLAARQNAYNAANPNALKNAVTLTPDFANNRITAQVVLPLAANAVTSLSAASVATVFTAV